MSLIPPTSRQQLETYLFRPDKRGQTAWILGLPPYYADLFSDREPALMSKSDTGWVDHKGAKVCRFPVASDDDRRRIQRFIDNYKRIVILGLNRHIADTFENELDSCIALDYRADRNKRELIRTGIGQLLYQAKYLNDRGARDRLVDELELGIHRLPSLRHAGIYSLSFIPPRPNKGRDLPRELVESLVDRLQNCGLLSEENPILYPELVIDKPDFKDLTSERKHEVWKKIYSRDVIQLSGSAVKQRIIVVDDLYQSGNTIWSYAGYLKSLGAAAVHGLVCVKTLRDTDNQ